MESFEEPPEVQIPSGASEKSSANPPDSPAPVPPPTPASHLPPTSSATESGQNRAILWVIGIIVGIVILIVVFGSVNSTTTTYSGTGTSGGGSYTPAAAPVYVPPPVSKALDEKNGFKEFHFGMTLDEARAVLDPTRSSRNEGGNTDTLVYVGTALNRIGEFATDSLELQFFQGRLFRIDIRFSNFQNEIFEALKINYGEPFDNNSWTRGTEALRAKCWMGEKTYAAIVAPTYGTWDAVIIYDQAANQMAREYADKEPERAANDFSTNGFKSLTMGMGLDAIPRSSYFVSEDDAATGIKKITINGGDLLKIGYYPLQSVGCEFFKERLYRIDLRFEENRKEVFKSVQARFGSLQNNDTWTRGSEKLTGRSAGESKFYVTVLAPGGASGGEEWDAIVLMDYSILQEAEQFKQDSENEAVKDISVNGFKSLTMGMSLNSLNADYTVREDSDVTGVKKISIDHGELLRMGAFRLRYVNCEFFKDQLYRIDLEFSEDRQEIFKIFEKRFAPLQNNDTWTQGAMKLSAKSGGSDEFYGTILAPGGEDWETIALLNLATQRTAEQFKNDAPKRAAKDL